MLIPRALSSDKAVYENNGRLLSSTTVLDIISNAVSRISEPPTMGNCTGNRAIVQPTDFIWMPYTDENIAPLIPSWVIEQQQIFMSNVLIIHFHMVEWHDGSRVLRQFGSAQPIPNPPVDIKEVHGMDKKGAGRDALNWAHEHETRPPLYALDGGFSPTSEYAAWYMAHGKPFIFQGQYMLIHRDAQPESSRWQPRNT
ncbi:serine/threonine-protein phosphatase 7 long form-like protein [Gossypium australe]|uniref:Serine/threonine-protein phosphatase 7 long form-like protein n=1 Tax=Gossypium australe TaxID=47621 RepID=A0A5B6W126_9ROSI|nr:serine/threonine-protein phosphatase 7 long form-like protein [Gossypium australe]